MTQLTKKQYTPAEKITFSVCIAAALVMIYGLTHFKSRKVKPNEDAQQINYEMAKLKTADSLYSLENREIELDYKALEAKKAALKATQNKTIDKTKKATNTKAATPQAQALQKAAQKNPNAAALKNSRFSVTNDQVVTALENSKSINNSTPSYATPISTAPTTVVETPEAVKMRSFEEWRSEIFAAQDQAVIVKLTQAYKKGEVTNEVFQQLVDEMLNSHDEKMISLGLYTLRASPSYASYIKLIKTQGTVSSANETYLQAALMAYHQNGLGVLKQALTNPEKAVVVKTLEVIKTGVTTIRNGGGSTLLDPRYRRNDQAFSLNSYLTFLPVLRDIISHYSNDPDIVNLANQSISAIGTGQAVASNN